MIPILNAHNPREAIGIFENGVVTLIKPMPQDVIFSVFGNCGYRALESEIIEGRHWIKKFEIIEWSLGL